MNIEIPLDDRRILRAKVTEVDASFSHEFGIKKERELEIENIEIQYFDDKGWDEFYLPRPKDIERLEQMIREYYYSFKGAG